VQGKPGNWPTRYGATDKAPSTSYVEGALFYSARPGRICQDRHAGIRRPAIALLARWTTPWVWPVRPPHDRGAAICAALVFTAGVAVAAARGARDQG